jgi:hypothetical protein
MSELRRPPSNRTFLIGALILLNVMVLGGAVKVLLDAGASWRPPPKPAGS